MFVDPYWNTFNTKIDETYFSLVFNINDLVYAISERPRIGENDSLAGPALYRLAAKKGFAIRTLDDYLAFTDRLFQEFLDNGVVCLKNSMAYGRTLDYEYVTYERAKGLFLREASTLSDAEKKNLQDFMFHWIIQKSIEVKLPIQIHTGYLAGNGNTLENSRPTKLNALFLRYPKATFVLFHGGYPWTGEYGALGKMFPNVYLDLVWLPQISREAAVRALDEMLDCVPYNKFFWGGDCHFIEESVGSLEFGKDVVAHVLAGRIERGLLTEDVAFEIARRIFRENAISVFKLNVE
ncbi:MAG: amidohydrolase family protein [bacterium]